MVSVNQIALDVFEEMIDFQDELRVQVLEQNNGTTIIDAGIEAHGGLEAGVYLSRLCMADLAYIAIITMELKDTVVAGVQVTTDYPIIACMASQYAGWKISGDNFFGMGSGPARAISKKPKELYAEIGYEDDSEVAVLVLEASSIPDENISSKIAEACNVDPDQLFIAVAPTSSVAGSVQISARIVETGIHKMESLGMDINTIKHGSGRAPIAPVVGDDMKCMGSTNDCVIYCGQAYYVMEYDDIDELKSYLEKVPSSTSKDYGKPFYVTFKEAEFDFFKVDPGVFAPAHITVNELKSGKSFTAGGINPEVLLESFGVQQI